MKKSILILVFAAMAYTAKAQDTIIMTNGDEVPAKVTAVTPNEVTYQRYDNLSGPQYTTEKSEIFMVKYENGTKDVFGSSSATTAKRVAPTIRFQGYGMLGSIFNADALGTTADVSVGVRVGKSLYAGLHTGVHSELNIYTEYEYDYDTGKVESEKELEAYTYIPLGVNLKGYLPIGNEKIYPYLNCSLGGFIGVGEDMRNFNGFFAQVGAGIDIRRFSVGLGYSCIHKFGTANMGYVQLGVRFGKNPY